MTIKSTLPTLLAACSLATLLAVEAPTARAHCDTMDGPIVSAARAALDRADLTPVLRWVRRDREPDISAAFALALAVRKQGDKARELADRFFFETLVRVHREGENAPYTGLRPAGSVEPVIAAADKALETGSAEALAEQVAHAAREAVLMRYAAALEKKKHADESIAAGRDFVGAYVGYIHLVEALHALASGGAAAHEETPDAAPPHAH
ncbi:MAG: hypothetical protein HYV63_02730 [Candidatus Schekmanbacteria bacterium]|nr:hypothetical protein [Candidatus Schekmanbacteria bacterium]